MYNRMNHAPFCSRMIAELPHEINETYYQRFLINLADSIIDKYEMYMLHHNIRRIIGEKDSFSVQKTKELLENLAEDDEVGVCRRREAATQDLTAYFSENESGSVEGLVRFRMPSYQQLLERTAQRILQLQWIQKEYNEFIALLRYFVQVQTERPRLIHLLIENETYRILDEKEKDITKKCKEELIPKNDSACFCADDVLISMLITAAPKRIIVHGEKNPEKKELYKTIEKVFEKVEYCSGCTKCKK